MHGQPRQDHRSSVPRSGEILADITDGVQFQPHKQNKNYKEPDLQHLAIYPKYGRHRVEEKIDSIDTIHPCILNILTFLVAFAEHLGKFNMLNI